MRVMRMIGLGAIGYGAYKAYQRRRTSGGRGGTI